jgi:hypothetical protein
VRHNPEPEPDVDRVAVSFGVDFHRHLHRVGKLCDSHR